MIRYTEYKILEMLTKCVKTLVFCSQCSLVTHACPLSNLCRVMFAHLFKLSFIFVCELVSARHKCFAWLEVILEKEMPLKFQSRVLEDP